MRAGKPIQRLELTTESDYAIVSRYQAEYRGLVQYYLLAVNVRELGYLRYVMERSLLKTLAAKHKAKVTAMARKYMTTKETPHGPMRCLRVTIDRGEDKRPLVAEFGGIPLRRKPSAVLRDEPYRVYTQRSDLLARLLAEQCEMCGSKENCQVHHIRKMATLHIKGRRDKPAWVKRMIALRRKTLVVCHACHVAIHAGRPTRPPAMETVTGEPDA
jgi:hypothetical protein